MKFNLSSLLPKWSKKSSSSSYDLYKELLASNTSKSGVPIDWKKAMTVSTALACGRVISEGLAQVPLKLYRSKEDGRGRDPAKDHNLFTLLHIKPNEWQTAFEFREQIGLHLSFKNNAYVYKVRGIRDEIVELLPFEPEAVRIINDGWERKYEVYIGKGKKIPVDAKDMWHIRGPSWNGINGMDIIKLGREALGLSIATEEHSARMFSNGARPGGVLSTDQPMSDEKKEEIKKGWQELYGGNDNAYKTAVLWGGLKFQSMAMTSVDAQQLEQRRLQVEEVCRLYRMFPIMVGQADKAMTYASAEQMFIAHVVHTMTPWYTRLEQSATVSLLSDDEIKKGYYFKHTINGLMRGSFKDRALFYSTLHGIGAFNSNEVREMEEMNPYEGGDEYRVQMNTEVPGQDTDNQGDSNNAATNPET